MILKKLTVKPILCIAALAIAISSCKKDDGDDTSKVEFLTANSWKIEKIEMSPAYKDPTFGFTITDLTSFIEACTLDDRITFNANLTVSQDEGATKCDDDDDPQTITGNWTFLENDTKIQSVIDGETEVYTIVELESGIFVGTQSVPDLMGDGVNRTVTVTFGNGN